MKTFALLFLALLLACGNPAPASAPPGSKASADPLAQAKIENPPFAVQGEAEGLLLVWYDAQGAAHTAHARSEVPEDQRARVRVDSLDVAPDQRLDPAFMYVADLRKARADGSYEVRKVARESFEAFISKASAKPESAALASASDVIIYGASWCGACKQAKRYFRDKGVAFIEKDIEKEPGARSEMQQKARAQGVSTSGIPVLDVRGTMMGGFDPNAIERVLASKGT
jgi:glutaredoxin